MKQELKRIYGEIQKNYPMRFYPKQKERFSNFIIGEFKSLGFDNIKLDSAKNIIIGDVDRAKKVYSAHYDTPMLSFYITPFARIFGHAIGVFISAFAMLILLLALSSFFIAALGIAVERKIVLAFALLLFMVIHLFPNPSNTNDNTSGVLTVLLAAMKLKKESNLQNAAFILFNNEELGLLGSGKFVKEFKKRNGCPPKFFIYNFDCTGIGKRLLIATTGVESKSIAKKISNEVFKHEGKSAVLKNASLLYCSDNLKFENGLMLTAANHSLFGPLYLPCIHMPYDNKIDFDRIEKICNYALT